MQNRIEIQPSQTGAVVVGDSHIGIGASGCAAHKSGEGRDIQGQWSP